MTTPGRARHRAFWRTPGARPGAVLALVTVVVASACSGSASAGRGIAAEPTAGSWKPWVLSSSARITVPPPPRPGSAQARQEAAEVTDMAARRTPDFAQEAHRWGDYPPTEPWTTLTMQLVSEQSKNPPLAARGYALVGAAVYDAVVSAWHWKYVYRREGPKGPSVVPVGADPSYPSEHAAIAGAASRVLAYLFPERPAAGYDDMAAAAAESRVAAGANYRSDVIAGLDLGRAVADVVIARADNDGAQDHGNVNRPTGTGAWEAPPDNPGNTQPVEPKAGSWRTWVVQADALVPGPPPAYGSPEHLAQAREVHEIGTHLTEAQKATARRWAAGSGTPLPPGIWNQIALDEVRSAAPMSTPRVARLFALLNTAQADAGVAAWATKYRYWSARPVNAIRDLGIDPAWKPLLPTPVFPSYVSGHSTFSAAAAEVLGYAFPGQATRFRSMAEEAGVSRLYGGIHYRADNLDGLALGRKVGAAVVRRARSDGAGASKA